MNLEKNNYSILKNLSYREEKNIILDSISFEIPMDKQTFILGNNGSGKSTLIDVITGNIKNYTGNLHIENISKGNSGVLFDTIPYSPTLRVSEIVKLFELVFNIPRIESLLIIEKLDLLKLFDKQFKVLSLGEKKRLGLFVALFHNPNLLILDEPFGGIDPNSINIISSLMFGNNRTVIISSHNWKLAEEKADYILFLYKGKQLLSELKTPHELLSDKYIPFSKKIIIDTEYKEIVEDMFFSNHFTINYDNNFHVFLDKDDYKSNLDRANIPYSISVKNLNDVYNYLINNKV